MSGFRCLQTRAIYGESLSEVTERLNGFFCGGTGSIETFLSSEYEKGCVVVAHRTGFMNDVDEGGVIALIGGVDSGEVQDEG